MATDCLFRDDSYLRECTAAVTAVTEAGGILLDRTVFYAASGGQPGDRGALRTASGDVIAIGAAGYTDREKTDIVHLPAAVTSMSVNVGEPVHVAIDWGLRHARMRMHTALHLL
jgi:misacylated tRNA(Ala) deacylase